MRISSKNIVDIALKNIVYVEKPDAYHANENEKKNENMNLLKATHQLGQKRIFIYFNNKSIVEIQCTHKYAVWLETQRFIAFHLDSIGETDLNN